MAEGHSESIAETEFTSQLSCVSRLCTSPVPQRPLLLTHKSTLEWPEARDRAVYCHHTPASSHLSGHLCTPGLLPAAGTQGLHSLAQAKLWFCR